MLVLHQPSSTKRSLIRMISETATICMAMGCCISSRAPATVNRKPKGLAPSLAREEIRIDADHRLIVKLLTDQPARMSMQPSVLHSSGNEDIDFRVALATGGSVTESSLDDEFFSVMRDFSAFYRDEPRCNDSICRIKSPPFAETSSSYPREDTRLTEENKHKPAMLFLAPAPSLSVKDYPEPAHLLPDPLNSKQDRDRNSIQPRNEMKLADYFPDSYWLKDSVADPREKCGKHSKHYVFSGT